MRFQYALGIMRLFTWFPTACALLLLLLLLPPRVSADCAVASDVTSLLSALSCAPRTGKYPLYFYLCKPTTHDVCVDLTPSNGVPLTLNGTIMLEHDAGLVEIFSTAPTRAIISGGWSGGTSENGVPVLQNYYGTLVLQHLELRDGFGWGTFGAAICNNGGNVTLDDVIVRNNTAAFGNGAGGGVSSVSVGGGAPHTASLTIKGGSVFSGNQAGPGSASSDILLAGGSAVVTDTAFSEIWIAESLPIPQLQCDTRPRAGYRCVEVDAKGYNGTHPYQPQACYSCEVDG